METAAPVPLINPYFELWRELKDLPGPVRDSVRKKLLWAYSWAVPSSEAIHELCSPDQGPLIELGAGTGYWAWLCAQAGGDIVAFDRASETRPHWHAVGKGSVEMLRVFPERSLFLCWPSLDEGTERFAEDALREFRGKRVIYAGEWRGRTAGAGFHDRLERDYRPVRTLELPVWPGFEDRLDVFERRT